MQIAMPIHSRMVHQNTDQNRPIWASIWARDTPSDALRPA